MNRLDSSHPPRDAFVSIIVPTYGRPERLTRLLEQLLAQTACSFQYEIIVVDDGSVEPIAPMVQPVCERSAVSVRLLRKPNGGPSSARNFGAHHAAGQFLLFVDDDMSVRSDFLSGHIETQERFGPAIVNCFFDWEVESASCAFGRWYQRRIAEWNDVRRSDLHPIGDEVFQISSALVTTANMSINRAEFEKVGGFDTAYTAAGCEDQDFSLRLARNGVRALMTRRTFATHVETHVSLEQLCQRQLGGAKDSVRFVRRFADLCGEPAIAIVNGLTVWRSDSWLLIARKTLKRLIVLPYVLPAVFFAIKVLERCAPSLSLLQRLYDLVVGAHIQQGWREGLKEYGDVVRLDLSTVVEG